MNQLSYNQWQNTFQTLLHKYQFHIHKLRSDSLSPSIPSNHYMCQHAQYLCQEPFRNQLRRVKAEVDPLLEISEIANRVMKSPSPEGQAA